MGRLHYIANILIALIMMLLAIGVMAYSCTVVGAKANGDVSRMKIIDQADMMTDFEEQEVVSMLQQVYDKSGIPVTVYTTDYEWKNRYDNLEVYSEELYYSMGYDEGSMIILFTCENNNGFFDWEYDCYLGDNTEQAFTYYAFNTFLSNFQKGMSNQSLSEAIIYAWSTVIEDLTKTWISPVFWRILVFLLLFFSIYLIPEIVKIVKINSAYKYFKEHPEELTKKHTVIYSVCPACGTSNPGKKEICEYCGTLLKCRDGNVRYVTADK